MNESRYEHKRDNKAFTPQIPFSVTWQNIGNKWTIYCSTKECNNWWAIFQGHFPDIPIMPGVLQVEIMAQASGLLASRIFEDKSEKDKELLLMTIDNARFRKPVTPGDVLIIKVWTIE